MSGLANENENENFYHIQNTKLRAFRQQQIRIRNSEKYFAHQSPYQMFHIRYNLCPISLPF